MPARAGLDRAAVVDAAVALVDDEGLDALALNRLASRLGVRTPSLYNHVAGLTGLRRELSLFGLRELRDGMGRAAIGRSGDAAVMAVAHAYRAFARRHPGVYGATIRAPAPDDAKLGAAADAIIAIVTAVLAPYELREDVAIHAIRGLRSLVHGFVTLEAAGGFGLPLDRDESFDRLLHMFIAGLHDMKADAGA